MTERIAIRGAELAVERRTPSRAPQASGVPLIWGHPRLADLTAIARSDARDWPERIRSFLEEISA